MANNERTVADPNTLRGKIEGQEFQLAIARILPTHLTPDRFTRIAISAMTRTPKLADCTQASVLQCLITLSQLGLEPDGRNAHLIPFGNVCTLIIDYKGLAALAKRSGQVSNVHADTVCENDRFIFNKGVVVEHTVEFKADRGKPYAYYAMVRYKDGTEQADAMTKAEVERIRKRSRAANSGPWVTDFDEMAKKTVFRRLSKWLELSPEFRDAVEADADELEEMRFENAVPITRPQIKRLTGKAQTTAKNVADWDEFSRRQQTPEVPLPENPQPLESGGEPGEPGQSTPEPNNAPVSAVAPKKKLRKKEVPSTEIKVGPNEQQVMMRLAGLKKTKEDLEAVARLFDALSEDQGWDQIGEEGFATLLENWALIEPEIQKL